MLVGVNQLWCVLQEIFM